mmetsp:Transcript_8555/g.14847  ORF Transcript_8555/g.14847 Transcript_8555/m.14847 type:complete len:234 (+) Transcript_8555:366-1067(+)
MQIPRQVGYTTLEPSPFSQLGSQRRSIQLLRDTPLRNNPHRNIHTHTLQMIHEQPPSTRVQCRHGRVKSGKRHTNTVRCGGCRCRRGGCYCLVQRIGHTGRQQSRGVDAGISRNDAPGQRRPRLVRRNAPRVQVDLARGVSVESVILHLSAKVRAYRRQCQRHAPHEERGDVKLRSEESVSVHQRRSAAEDALVVYGNVVGVPESGGRATHYRYVDDAHKVWSGELSHLISRN